MVLSFDLISKDPFVVEADICSNIPLPGSEGTRELRSEGEGHIVDIVVCALSLMATNWPNCIREAWRILKPGLVLCHFSISESQSGQWTTEDSRSCE